MKTLIWKEWRELRLIPIAAAALFLMITLLWIFSHQQSRALGFQSPPFGDYLPSSAVGVSIAGYLLAGALSGAGLFANEIGSGSLAFLTMLPVSRKQIWLAKVYAGLLNILVTVIALFGTALVMLGVFICAGTNPAIMTLFANALTDVSETWGALLIGLAAAIGCFGVAATVSLLVDRALASAVLSIIACAALPIAISTTISSTFRGDTGDLIYLALALILPGSLGASYYIFLNGETLRTGKRFLLLGRALAVCAVVSYLAVESTYFLRMNPIHYSYSSSRMSTMPAHVTSSN